MSTGAWPPAGCSRKHPSPRVGRAPVSKLTLRVISSANSPAAIPKRMWIAEKQPPPRPCSRLGYHAARTARSCRRWHIPKCIVATVRQAGSGHRRGESARASQPRPAACAGRPRRYARRRSVNSSARHAPARARYAAISISSGEGSRSSRLPDNSAARPGWRS